MNCRSCGAESFVLRTSKNTRLDVRRRACECGDTWETNEREVPGSRRGGAPRKRPQSDAGATNSAPIAPPSRSEQKKSDQVSGSLSDLNPDPPGNQTGARVSDPIAAAEKEVFSFPLVGDGAWSLADRLHREYAAAFPHLDLVAEYAKARSWLVSNPRRKKTARGMPAFLNGWLERAQNRGAAAGARPANPRCAFHRAYGTNGKLPPSGAVDGCPECKHVSAARGTRWDAPTPVSDELPAWMQRKVTPATGDELAALRAEQKAATGG